MALHESLESFPFFDVDLVGDVPSGTAAIGDGVAALGSPDALGGAGAVAIYCYSKARNAWGYVGVITGSKAPGPGQIRGMGSSVIAIGNQLVVGAKGEATTPGAVFVLSPPYGVWSYATFPVTAELVRPGYEKGDFFGASMAHCTVGDDHYVAISAPGATPPAGVTGSGQVFIFKGLQATETPWSTTIANPNPSGSASDQFGASLDLDSLPDGTFRLAVGAPGANGGKGAVFVGRTTAGGSTFEFGPALVAVFPEVPAPEPPAGGDVAEGAEAAPAPEPPAPITSTDYGRAVALAGSTLLVGAPADPDLAAEVEGTGAVWMYKDAGGTFELLDERMYGPAQGAKFGQSLSVPRPAGGPGEAAKEVIVGAPGAAVAYRCRRRPGGDGFGREDPLVRIKGKRADGFGTAVATSTDPRGTWYFVAAPGDAKAGVDSGGFLYGDGDAPTWMETPPLNANPPIRWGGLNQDWWKKFTPGVDSYVAAFLAQPEEARAEALASAAEGLG